MWPLYKISVCVDSRLTLRPLPQEQVLAGDGLWGLEGLCHAGPSLGLGAPVEFSSRFAFWPARFRCDPSWGLGSLTVLTTIVVEGGLGFCCSKRQ